MRSSRVGRVFIWSGIVVVFALVIAFWAIGYMATAPYIGENPRWRGINRGPGDFGLTGETVSFPATDEIALKAWWLPAEGSSRGNVILAHGIDHTRQVMLPRAQFLVHAGFNVLALDLRGHGESAAQYSSTGYLEARDILGAIHYVRDQGHREPIVLMGISLGAAASFMAAAQSSQVAAVIADGAYLTGRDVLTNINRRIASDRRANILTRTASWLSLAPGVPRAMELVYSLRTGIDLGPELGSVVQSASRISVPVLIISGGSDWIVPPSQAQQLLAALPVADRAFVEIPNASHDTTFSTNPVLYQKAVLAFLDANVPR